MRNKSENFKKNGEYWEKRVANSTWKIYNSIEERNRDLLEFYVDASKRVKEELYDIAERYSKDGVLSLSDLHKRDRLTALNAKYEAIAKELGEKIEKTSISNMQDGFKEVYRNTAAGMGDVDFSLPNKKIMDKLLNEPWRGDSFSGRLWKNQKRLAVGLNEVLLAGLQQGKTVTEIAIQLHNLVGNEFNNCHRLVRTESMHYLNSASLQRYRDADVKWVQIWCAIDERTCEDCGRYHEKYYRIGECPILPFHANCRCTILPVTDTEIISELEKN